MLLASSTCVSAAEVVSVRLNPAGEVVQAEVFFEDGSRVGSRPSPYRGVLVLCPGQNGTSQPLLLERDWQDFARKEKLALFGIRFVSSDGDLRDGGGYFVAARGSGELLERGLEKAGLAGLPIYLYGFSGGAHFVMSFAAWRPDNVFGFCAYSFAWWSPPPKGLDCPALIACGQADGTRYGSSLAYFQAGRKLGKPWAWASLEGIDHQQSPELDRFVRAYFSAVLRVGFGTSGTSDGKRGSLVDNITEKVVSGRRQDDVGVSVLPDSELLEGWRDLHHP